MKNKKTLVLGASTNPERYAYKAINMLTEKGHTVLAIGQKTGEVAGAKIHTKTIPLKNIDTVTLYLNPLRLIVTITTTLSKLNPNALSSIPVPKIPSFTNCCKATALR